jgi:FkbM family methyltransferase
MRLRQRIAHLLDRPGLRPLLAKVASRRAQSLTKDPGIAVVYDGMWIDVVDQTFIPRSKAFRYSAPDVLGMRALIAERLSASLDYWTYLYRPAAGDVVVEIGAGIGIDCLSLSPLVGPSGRIYAVEPHPWTFQALSATCRLNRIANVTPINVALSDRAGPVWITDLDNSEINSISPLASSGSIEVPSMTLDELMAAHKIDRVAFLKMNIEGAETMAMKGMSASLAKIDHIVIACHDFLGVCTRAAVWSFFAEHGFDVENRAHDERAFVRDHLHGRRRRPG